MYRDAAKIEGVSYFWPWISYNPVGCFFHSQKFHAVASKNVKQLLFRVKMLRVRLGKSVQK